MPKLLSFGELADNRTDIVIPDPHVSVPIKMMKTHTFASPNDVKSARRVLLWARSYLIGKLTKSWPGKRLQSPQKLEAERLRNVRHLQADE
jgi:hypothetical protein